MTPEVEYPVDNGQRQCEEECRPKPGNQESGYDGGGKHDEERIDDKREEAEREDGYRKREDNKDRANEKIERAEDNGGNERTNGGYDDVGHDVCCDQNCES